MNISPNAASLMETEKAAQSSATINTRVEETQNPNPGQNEDDTNELENLIKAEDRPGRHVDILV